MTAVSLSRADWVFLLVVLAVLVPVLGSAFRTSDAGAARRARRRRYWSRGS